ncbi:MAG TPA: T9SS type A sorting domain-containing protein [Saprospiraceae bacterium]|nr:T9SS type A sorting domain-containing protein [Saprospiraceae bacterium]HMQ85550.1 T9SS type A sorting domain-containing protein [Saprospiraceae bacterium]
MKKNVLTLLFAIGFFASIGAQPFIIFEEQFDGGIPETWEIGAGEPEGAIWQWSADGQADVAEVAGELVEALYWGGDPIESPSVANGVAMYNSDVYDSGGTTVGGGPFPGTTVGTLTSPSIDCSEHPIVYLKFNQYARSNANAVATLVEVSSDGGQSWTDYPINRRVVENNSTNPNDVEIIDISEVAANEADVKIRFTWDGRYYYWLIDDVQLITPPQKEWVLGDIFYPPASFAQPVSQVATDSFGFSADVTNLGDQPISNLVLKISILNSSNTAIYVDSIVVETFPALTKDSTLQIEKLYAPELNTGDYALRYDVYSLDDADFNPTDNARREAFRVTSNLFAKEDDLDIAFRPSVGGDYQVGNMYLMSPNAGNNFTASTITFAAAKNSSDGPLAGSEVTFLMYKVKDNIPANFAGFETSSNESLDLVGFGSYAFVNGDENFELLNTELVNLDGNPIALEAGARYFLVASYVDQDNVIFHAFDDDVDYFQISTVVFADEWSLGGFGPENSAVLRMRINMAPVTTQDILEASSLQLFPNPVTDRLSAEVVLDQPETVLLILADMNGQVLEVREREKVQRDRFEFSMDHYPAGNYLLRLSTPQGVATKPFTLVK